MNNPQKKFRYTLGGSLVGMVFTLLTWTHWLGMPDYYQPPEDLASALAKLASGALAGALLGLFSYWCQKKSK
jgi:hypothetical protein